MMAQLKILFPAAKFLKKLKDKRLKALYQEAIDRILEDHTVGEAKTGDLAGVPAAVPAYIRAATRRRRFAVLRGWGYV